MLISKYDAIWIAVAIKTTKHKSKKKLTLEDVSFPVSTIKKLAQGFTEEIIENIDIEKVTAHKEGNLYNYLVDVNGRKRISYMGEFAGVRECPTMQVLSEARKTDSIKETANISSVFEFVNRDYTDKIKKGIKATNTEVMPINKVASIKEDDVEVRNKKKNVTLDKNMILYGPPGTGKTYNSAIYAVAICDGKSMDELTDYDAVMDRFNQLKKEGRIAFTTFHQSYGYEEFIEGIKPVMNEEGTDISYEIEPGAFKRFCEVSKTPANIDVNPEAKIWFVRLEKKGAFSLKEECYKNNKLVADDGNDDYAVEYFVNTMKVGDYVVSYAGDNVYIDAIGIIKSDVTECIDDSTLNPVKQYTREVEWTTFAERVNVREINSGKYLPNFMSELKYMKLSELLRLLPDTEKEDKPCVFIIDEINRGNISKIFGELITLIENTKREGEPEAASAVLPYSGESFSVPSNVYILGTMNTADRSIALMDTALRRRFRFIEMMPDADVLRKIHANMVETVDVAAILETINERITYLYDREHTIGHAFFTGLRGENATLENLAGIFEKSVIPLLQEYFYEDYQKIQLVLGDNAKSSDDYKFIKDEKVVAKNIFKGNVEDVIDLPEKKYSINKDAFGKANSYREII